MTTFVTGKRLQVQSPAQLQSRSIPPPPSNFNGTNKGQFSLPAMHTAPLLHAASQPYATYIFRSRSSRRLRVFCCRDLKLPWPPSHAASASQSSSAARRPPPSLPFISSLSRNHDINRSAVVRSFVRFHSRRTKLARSAMDRIVPYHRQLSERELLSSSY